MTTSEAFAIIKDEAEFNTPPRSLKELREAWSSVQPEGLCYSLKKPWLCQLVARLFKELEG